MDNDLIVIMFLIALKFDNLGLLKNVEHQFVFIITDTDSDDNERVKQHLALGTHPALSIEIFFQIGIKET